MLSLFAQTEVSYFRPLNVEVLKCTGVTWEILARCLCMTLPMAVLYWSDSEGGWRASVCAWARAFSDWMQNLINQSSQEDGLLDLPTLRNIVQFEYLMSKTFGTGVFVISEFARDQIQVLTHAIQLPESSVINLVSYFSWLLI